MNSRSGQKWTLIAAVLASGIVFLDSSVVNVALPTIDRELEAGLSGLQWVVDGYILTLAAFLILGGSLGDRYGRRRVMMFGLSGFAAASIACGLAPSVTWLVVARLFQGMCGALLVLSPKIGQLAGYQGPRLFMTLGPMGIATGLLLLTRLRLDSTYIAGLLPGVVVMGLGLATTVAPLTDTVISSVTEGRAGVAAAFNNVVSRVAALLAVAGLAWSYPACSPPSCPGRLQTFLSRLRNQQL